MANGRKILREYAKSQGYDVKEFTEIIPDNFYDIDTLVFKDSRGSRGECMVNYKDLFHFILKNSKNLFNK